MLDLASIMSATLPPFRRTVALMLHVRIPAALPALASGLRVATGVAPIGPSWGSGSAPVPGSAT